MPYGNTAHNESQSKTQGKSAFNFFAKSHKVSVPFLKSIAVFIQAAGRLIGNTVFPDFPGVPLQRMTSAKDIFL